jgi:phage-related protein
MAEEADGIATKSKGAKSSLDSLSSAMGIFSKASQFATMAATGGVGAVMGLANALTGSLTGALDSVQKFVSGISDLVKLTNPGVLELFTQALEDAQAVVGGALTPIMQGLTILVMGLGDSLASLMPVIQPLIDAIGQYFANYMIGAAQVLKAASPLIEIFIDVMTQLTEHLSRGIAICGGWPKRRLHEPAQGNQIRSGYLQPPC